VKIQFVSEIFPLVHSSILRLLTVGLLLCALVQPVAAQEIEGSRPYELDWAGRFSDDHEPLIDFEEMEGWTIKAIGGKAEICRSEEQKIWGIYTAKIKYKGDTAGASFIVSPPVPVKIPDPFTDVNMWVWNDYWKWEDDRDQPIAKMSILLETNKGDSYEIPFYSECDNNYYYAGLTTGSGACEHGYNFDKEPWLVDFYIRKMQPISCHWALGLGERTDEGCDRFFAKTIAFAQPGGFLGGWRHEFDHYMIRGYYMIQQLQSYYCQALIKNISYADKKGKLLDVSAAIATGSLDISQIRLEYDNGLVVWVNGHNEDNWKTPEAILPPSGYYAHNQDGSLVVFSALNNGHRVDYVHSPAYDYIDGRGKWLQTPWGASDGQLIILKNEDGSLELIPYGTDKFAVATLTEPAAITALDMDKNKIAKTKGEFRDGLFFIETVQGAVSYKLEF